ncbi:uncharacterized protein [Anoplolepis gracilipes]|uniref:uncharacterized protein n=1 Tax=Anoplolepis gracilipes TaxID=354296 RepID=UPI003B9FF600
MEKNSFSNFDELRYKAREIDEGIEKLTEIWKTPHLLVGGYAERTVQTDKCLEEVRKSIRDTGDKVKKFQSELDSSVEDTDQFLKESEKIYQELKEQCDNLDIVLAEYGYHYKEGDSMQEKREDSKDDSLLRNQNLTDLEIEFTPNLTWKCKTKSK